MQVRRWFQIIFIYKQGTPVAVLHVHGSISPRARKCSKLVSHGYRNAETSGVAQNIRHSATCCCREQWQRRARVGFVIHKCFGGNKERAHVVVVRTSCAALGPCRRAPENTHLIAFPQDKNLVTLCPNMLIPIPPAKISTTSLCRLSLLDVRKWKDSFDLLTAQNKTLSIESVMRHLYQEQECHIQRKSSTICFSD